jgi:ribosomal protein L33
MRGCLVACCQQFLGVLLIMAPEGSMNFTVNNFFRQIQIYTALTQGIRIIFTDYLPIFHVVRKVLTMLASKSSNSYHLVTTISDKKEPFKLALKRYLNMHIFYSVYDLPCKEYSQSV